MVDNALLEQVLRLDAESRRELIRAVEESIDHEEVPAGVRAEVERRLADMGPGPSADYITLDEFRGQVLERRARRTA
ncbi:MAG: hypothetical protein FWH11_07620 [Micrococcales bacterium]|nr:hypothetical protein [Micrococcales bacterium]